MKKENLPKRKRTKEAKSFGRRTFIFSLLSFMASLVFALFNGVMAIVSHSVWYACMAGYFFLLSIMRIYIILRGAIAAKKLGGVKLSKKQLNIYLFCGIWIVLLECALTAAVVRITSLPQQPYGTIMAIAVATYTFYKIAVAIKNLIRAREYNDYAVQSLRNLAFVDAAVSMISLTATLTATFGEPQDMQTLTISVAAAIGALIIAFGVFMVVRAAILIKKFN